MRFASQMPLMLSVMWMGVPRMRSTSVLMWALVAMLGGCRSVSQHRGRVQTASTSAAFEKRILDNGSATFRSWNGKAYRVDSDTEIAFFPDGSVQMLEWGYKLEHYAGRYKVHPDGFVSVWFKGYQQEWPTMRIEGKDGTLFLRPFNEQNQFMFGNRGGSSSPRTEGTFWPLRMIGGQDEAEVLRNLKNQQDPVRPPT